MKRCGCYYNVSYYVLCAFVLSRILGCIGLDHEISKRALLFPQNTVLQLTFGIGIPIVLRNRRQIVYNYGYQQNYDLPYNLTNFMVATYYARSDDEQADISKEALYVYIMNTLDYLELNGEQCLLRAICEVARTPFHVTKKNSILEKIAQFIFTPSRCCSFDDDLRSERGIDNLTFADGILHARNLGLAKRNCGDVYDKCALSIVDVISQKYYVH